MEYYDIYKLRLNRYGLDYQSRIQSKREKSFELYLQKTVYRVEFEYNKQTVIGSFEKYKQDDTKTLHYLLTPTNINIEPGTLLDLPDKDGVDHKWMVYYLEEIKASGYNRYVMLRMSHYIQWIDRAGEVRFTWAYLYGQEDNMLKDELKSRSRMDTLYTENLKASFFIAPLNEYLKKDNYVIVGEKPYQEYFRITGYDLQSSKGVIYVTIDPVYEHDLTPPPDKQQGDADTDFFWLHNGAK